MGDYGSGKTVVLQSAAQKLLDSGRDIVYINALDWSDLMEDSMANPGRASLDTHLPSLDTHLPSLDTHPIKKMLDFQ